MFRLAALVCTALLGSAAIHAQTSDLIFFTDDGTKFTLVVDGDQKNDAPATRVVATGIRNESPIVIVRFADAAIPQIKKGGFFPLGSEYTVMITTNKKGERVMRGTGQAALGTTAHTETPSKPVTFVEDAPEAIEADEEESVTVVQEMPMTTTTTTTVTEKSGGNGENVNMSIGMNGFGFDMNVNVDDDMDMNGSSSTTTTTTHTTTTTTHSSSGTVMPTPTPIPPSTKPKDPEPVKEPAAYSMPGYSGPIGCAWPMNPGEFTDAKTSIESKSFEETKMTTAKQIGRDRCFTVDQVKGIMGTFSFEDTKLEFAKYAYDRTYDIGNYYKVNDSFTFESSIDELNTYIQSR